MLALNQLQTTKVSLQPQRFRGKAFRYQHTLAKSIFFKGIGVHSGQAAELTIKPAPQDTGYVFIRTDVEKACGMVPATWDAVVDTQMNTTLANQFGTQVSTVEHVLAALVGCGVDNAILEVNGPEVPIMDGSALAFAQAIQASGLEKQPTKTKYIKVLKPIQVTVGQATAFLLPADEPCLYVQFNAHGRMATQYYTFFPEEDNFSELLSSARTFGFYEDAQKILALGLAQGASLDNTVIFDQDKILNPNGLRFDDECVRHKVLDVVGDLALAGGRLIAHYDGVNPGHSLNNKLLRALFADASAWSFED